MKREFVLTYHATAVLTVDVPDDATEEQIDAIGEKLAEDFSWDEATDDRITFFDDQYEVYAK